MHADKKPEPLNLGVPVVYFPRANAFLARTQALLWVRDWSCQGCRNHGCSGCKCTPCLLHFQLCGCSAGADYGCNGCTKLLQQTELNVVRGCVWGCFTPQSSGIWQSCYPFGERWNGKHYLWNFWREITEELCLNNCIRSEKIWWRGGRLTRM
jgi:hypothetical protein